MSEVKNTFLALNNSLGDAPSGDPEARNSSSTISLQVVDCLVPNIEEVYE
jgi:hypothetical protein